MDVLLLPASRWHDDCTSKFAMLVATTKNVSSSEPHPPSRHSTKRWFYVLGAAVGTLFVAWVALAIFAKRIEPFLKERVIRDLSQRFEGNVEIGGFHVIVAPTLHITGENLVMRSASDDNLPPLITIQRFEFAASAFGLLRWPLSIGSARISGLTIVLPPRGQRPTLPHSSKAGKPTLFVLRRVLCDGARLELLTNNPGKLPLVFEIHSLRLDSAGPGRAMPFDATLTEPKPLGEIAAHGQFGPWQTEEPRNTPVSGVYSFTDADLGTIKGIGGTLSSTGNFNGELDEIQVQGKTDTPNFTVSTGGHPMPLHTDFNATVDGTTGDTYLHPVRAKLGGSGIIANGSVVRQKPEGHLITLDVTASNAQIEDLLKVAVKTLPPALSGPVNFKARLVLPPAKKVVAERVRLNGTFELPAAHFSNTEAQMKVDQLSLRAQGRPKEAQEDQGGEEVFSKLEGNFSVKDGVVSLPAFRFSVPGALVSLAGDYRLTDQHFDFQGTARMDAKPSQMTTGVKSFFLKAIDPFFSKKGAGTVLPIEISGEGTHPSVRLHLGRSNKAQVR